MKHFLENKTVTAAIIIVAILGRAVQIIFFHGALFDVTLQTISMQHFVEGHGLSLPVAHAADISKTIYAPLVNWPPGYALLLSPFYILLGKNYLLAGIVLELLAAIAIILYSRKILSTFNVPLYILNLFTLFSGFYIYYFYFIGSVDSLAIAFFLAAIYYAILLIRSSEKDTRNAIACGFLLLIAASLKYLFCPIVFVLPLFLLLYGYYNHLQWLKKASVLSLILLVGGMVILVIWQKSMGGSAAYISSPGRGLFPGHLLEAYPFIPASFTSQSTIEKIAPASAPLIMDVFRVIHVLIFVSLFIFFLSHFAKKGLRKNEPVFTFMQLSFVITIAITALLVLLSVRVEKEEIMPGYLWTYIQDPRYYGLAEILFHIILFLLYWNYRHKVSAKLKWLFLVLPFLLIPETLRGMFFDLNRLLHLGKETYYWQQERPLQKYTQSLIRSKSDSLHTKNIVLTGTSYYINSGISLYNRIPILAEPETLRDITKIRSSQPALLFVVLREDERDLFSSFINSGSVEHAGNFNGFYIYSYYATN